MSSQTQTGKVRKTNEVEKFKRRIIRAVARHQSESNEEEMESMWEMMKKETRCDCKLLWERMRALTIKKLKRLLPANDRMDGITNIARLTATDWLLFDLVLVHEKIDVIGQELWENGGEEPEVLYELFFLVQEHDIEELTGQKLVDAWLSLTREYNDGDRKCSPMMLQRRWYQMKYSTRTRFYSFWDAYRGIPNHLDRARAYKPTNLQIDLVRKYREIIVDKFYDWNELINHGKVILAHEFDERIAATRRGQKTQDNQPEVELVEPNVVTITVEEDSDSENSDEKDGESISKNKLPVKIKTETVESIDIDEMDSLKLLESINIPCETPFGQTEQESSSISESILSKEEYVTSEKANDVSCDENEAIEGIEGVIEDDSIDGVLDEVNTDITKEISVVIQNDHRQNSENNADVLNKTSQDIENVGIIDYEEEYLEGSYIPADTVTSNSSHIYTTSGNSDNSSLIVNQPEITVHHDEGNTSNDIFPKITNVTSIGMQSSTAEPIIDAVLAQKANTLAANINISNEISNVSSPSKAIEALSSKIVNDVLSEKDFIENFEDLPSDIQFVDDGIVIDDEEEDVKVKIEVKKEINEETETGKVDEKLLLFPTVYTKKLDDMKVFRHIQFDQIRDKNIIEDALIENKPIEIKTVVKEEILIPKVEPSDENTENDKGSSSDEDDVSLNELQKHKIKISSWLFKKPRVKNYNPIQLCKNPDFNTRLKRLTAGFLSYERNRYYLKQCLPLTIDVHKSFECHLTQDNTFYLQGDGVNIKNIPERSTPTSIPVPNLYLLPSSTPSPSPPPCPSLPTSPSPSPQNICITQKSYHLPIPCIQTVQSSSAQRNKVVNLPDINEVRRINQKLLCAEVAPIQTTSLIPPDTLVSNIDLSNEEIEKTSIKKDDSQDIIEVIDSSQNHSTSKDIVTQATGTPSINKNESLHTDLTKSTNSNTSNEDELRNCINSISNVASDIRTRGPKKKKEKPQKGPRRFYRPMVPWIPKSKSTFGLGDVLLASDTVDKMLMLFAGEPCIIGKKKIPSNPVYKSVRPTIIEKEETNLKTQNEPLVIQKREEVKKNEPLLVQKREEIKNNEPLLIPKKRGRKPKLCTENKKPTGREPKERHFCCWARKKIARKGVNDDVHTCQIKCSCCCRHVLAKMLKRRAARERNKCQQADPIILSDDDSNAAKKNIQIECEAYSLTTAPNSSFNRNIENFDESSTSNAAFDKSDATCAIPPFKVNIFDSHTSGISQKNKSFGGLRLTNISELTHSNISQSVHETSITNENLSMNSNVSGTMMSDGQNMGAAIGSDVKTKIKPSSYYDAAAIQKRMHLRRSNRLNPQTTLKSISFLDEVQGLENQQPTSEMAPPKTSPIFIGKNKILLTSKFPVNPPVQPAPTPQIILPNGVHFVLLPNRELAMSIDPGVELDQTQMNELQALIRSIQKQFDAIPNLNNISNQFQSGAVNTLPSSESDKAQGSDNINLNNDLPPHITEPVTNTNQEENFKEVTELDEQTNGVTNTDVNSTAENTLPVNDDEHKGINYDVNSQNKPDTENKSTSDVGSSRKTILSDLMEMSGISEEDAKMSEMPRYPVMTINPLTNISQENHETPQSAQDVNVTDFIQAPTALAALAQRPNLKIVTAYQDLKWSFENKCKFFKLDIVTGDIVPVSVSIKRREQIYKNLNTSSRVVVDLTDDNNDNDKPVNSEAQPNTDSAAPQTNTPDQNESLSIATPVKLFRAIRPSILRNNNKGLTVIKTVSKGVGRLKKVDPKKILTIFNSNKRKFTAVAPASVDLLDSDDECMEHDNTQKEKIAAQSASNELHDETSEDESDEEPLAKKKKRKCEIDASSVQEDNVESNKILPNEEIFTPELPNEMLLDQEFTMFEPPANDSEEDCILGV